MAHLVKEKQQEVKELLTGQQNYATIDDQIGSLILDQKRHPKIWYAMIGIGFLGANLLLVSIAWLVYQGIEFGETTSQSVGDLTLLTLCGGSVSATRVL